MPAKEQIKRRIMVRQTIILRGCNNAKFYGACLKTFTTTDFEIGVWLPQA